MDIKLRLQEYLDSYLNPPQAPIPRKTGIFGGAVAREKQAFFSYDALACDSAAVAPKIDEFIKDNETDDRFQKLLFNHIDSRNLKDSDVYNKVCIDRRLFSKIRNENYHPSKETVILLALSLELTENELDELLTSASYSLPKNNTHDLIIRFCFKEKIYNIFDVNELLSSYNCKVFE